ncbi:MAG: hypothetical protein GX780_02810 [Campylobacteraceae bacterium]|nr:hypothetical protein [Campylobacteraceae bacterium]
MRFKSAFFICLCVVLAWAKPIHEAKVTDVVHAGSYTYLGINNKDRNYWVVVQRADFPVGSWVRFEEDMAFPTYHSKALNRDFEDVVFTNSIYYKTELEENKNLAFMDKALEVSPYRKKGTISIEEIQNQGDKLKDKTITLRAKVVKVSTNILDRNWIHLQDGTGVPNPGEAAGRIVVTSSELPKVGEVVTAEGTLRVDKSFGSGYVYPFIIENTYFKVD